MHADRRNLRALTEHVHTNLLARDKSAASDVDDACIVLWRILGDRRTFQDHVEWVCKQIDLAMPTSMRFALALESRWTFSKFGQNIQPGVRSRMVERVQEHVRQVGAEDFLAALDPAYPYSLNHLIRHQYEDAVYRPVQWAWLMPELIAAANRRPELLVPHLAFLFSRTSREYVVDEETGLPDFQFAPRLDEDYISELLTEPEQRLQFMGLIAEEREYLDLPDNLKEEMRQLQAEAQSWLTEHPKG